MDPETFGLLKRIVDLSNMKGSEARNVSIYDLIDEEKKRKGDTEELIKSVIKRAYQLAEMGLVRIESTERDDGLETVLRPTMMGNAYAEFETVSGGKR